MDNAVTPEKFDVGIRARWGSWHIAAVVVAGTLSALILGAVVWAQVMQTPAGLDFSTTTVSEAGHFRATIKPSVEPVPVNQLHTWVVHVETMNGVPVESATISVDGDMPQHGHGMPTVPSVTEELGGGDYLVEGMKFQMGGWWVVEFEIETGEQTDLVKFNLSL